MGNDLARGPALPFSRKSTGKSEKYEKTMNVVMKIFQGNKYKDIDEIEDSFKEATPQI